MLKKLTATVLLLCSTQVLANEVNVYSTREEQLIKPLLDAFSKDNGVKVNLITGDDDPLLERLKREGANSPADVLITADAGRLHRAVEAGTLQPIQSAKLNQAIPANLRDPANQWFGLTYRARVLFYNPAKVQANELSTYEDLADPKWRKVKMFFPNQRDRGTHINISGAGVTKSAKNKENAVKLLEYIALDDA
ncbi:extracellular solute-binding protein [Thiothrix subterranea]|uniref:Extracellular solute-binding protein n=1 Tax=Thiothrix subterranea TaxID=2735563 RepID=A0AA51R464_9GAMM|nr:extracellular solute-binding protein [Thiothrix subterranea]MDQ5769302.1 extracellular solute-binding protein [Thiothrix subterranea]WML86285.1 extracellular solute-binding protein [Thiothrix subterranea]